LEVLKTTAIRVSRSIADVKNGFFGNQLAIGQKKVVFLVKSSCNSSRIYQLSHKKIEKT